MKIAEKKYLPERLFTTKLATTLFVKNAGKMTSWNAKGAEILFLATKRIKATMATSATVATVIYLDKRKEDELC